MSFIRTGIVLLMMVQALPAAPGWRCKSHVSLSYLHDNNVFESLKNRQSDHVGRFMCQFSTQNDFISSGFFQAVYQAGVEGYASHTSENRMVNDLNALCQFRVRKSFSLCLPVQARAKTYFEWDWGYGFYSTEPALLWIPSRKIQSRLFFSMSSFDYQQGREYDHRFLGWGLSLRWEPLENINWFVQWRGGRLTYRRNALQSWERNKADEVEWVLTGNRQQDDLNTVFLSLEIYQWALFQWGAGYQWNRSNSVGFSYNRPRATLLVSKKLPWNLTMSVFWQRQWKHYQDVFLPLLQIRPERDVEENEIRLLELARELRPNLSVRCRWAWYENESPFRDRYYEKQRLSLGFSLIF